MRTTTIAAALLLAASPAAAELTRIDAANVTLDLGTAKPASVWVSRDTRIDEGDRQIEIKGAKATLPMPASERSYVILRDKDGRDTVVAERVLPLEHGSNFRDVGGYVTKDGRRIRWGKAFRSGAMPLFTEADYALVGQLGIGSVVDFRSLEERSVAPDQIDDRTGALFIANDYSMKPMMARMAQGNGENTYRGMEKMLAPQYRAMFRRLIADEGAVVYHCSAGQDRTGIATALLYDFLGVDRATILEDYHLSTTLRRPEWEMPPVDPKDHPDNPIVQYYMARPKEQRMRAEPLYTPSGASHLTQFFAYIDQEYGGSEGYLRNVLGLDDNDLAKLRAVMLE